VIVRGGRLDATVVIGAIWLTARCHESPEPSTYPVMDDRDADAFLALYRARYRTVCRHLAARTNRVGAVVDAAALAAA
jgi:hypothetical protein